MKNERHKLGNPTETRTIQSRTQIAKQHSELVISDLHRIPESYIAPSPRQQSCPAAADPPRGQERCWRGIGDRNPLSLFNRPREEPIKSTRMTWYSPLVKPEKTIQVKRSLPYKKEKDKHKPPQKLHDQRHGRERYHIYGKRKHKCRSTGD